MAEKAPSWRGRWLMNNYHCHIHLEVRVRKALAKEKEEELQDCIWGGRSCRKVTRAGECREHLPLVSICDGCGTPMCMAQNIRYRGSSIQDIRCRDSKSGWNVLPPWRGEAATEAECGLPSLGVWQRIKSGHHGATMGRWRWHLLPTDGPWTPRNTSWIPKGQRN